MMVSQSFFAISLIAIICISNGSATLRDDFCPEKNRDMKKAAMMTEMMPGNSTFLGCKTSKTGAARAMRRANWLIPTEGITSAKIKKPTTEMRKSFMEKTKMSGHDFRRVLRRISVINRAFKKPGKLQVSPECLYHLERDLVISVLGNARSAREFNRVMKKLCKEGGMDIAVSVRDTFVLTVMSYTIEVVECTMPVILEDDMGNLVPAIIVFLKEIMVPVIVTSCPPSDGPMMARYTN